jgi:hypothetical protein
MAADEAGKKKCKQILPGMVAGSYCLAATWEKCPAGNNETVVFHSIGIWIALFLFQDNDTPRYSVVDYFRPYIPQQLNTHD